MAGPSKKLKISVQGRAATKDRKKDFSQDYMNASDEEISASGAEETVMAKLGDLADLVAVVLHEQAKSSFGLTPEVKARLRGLQREIEDMPGQQMAMLLQDMHKSDASRADVRDFVHTVVGCRRLDGKSAFPVEQEPSKIDRSWKDIRKHVKESFGRWDQPTEPEPKAEDAGYIATHMDDLMKNRPNFGLESPKQFIEELASYLESPFSVQALLGALLCGWLFSGPEPMCDEVYSEKEMKVYEALMLAGKLLNAPHKRILH